MYQNNKDSNKAEVFYLDRSFRAVDKEFQIEKQLDRNPHLNFKIVENKLSINQSLCHSLGYSNSDLPWNQLRAIQLGLAKKFKLNDTRHTLVCCDPVMMQVTHRGAYLWGQGGLNFTNDETHSIVEKINKELMAKGEYFYRLNNHQWLYFSEQEIQLEQPSFESEIGRDQFGFSYKGKDSHYWNRLATEIQMLIKKMIDYEGLTQVPPESMINVCFWGNTDNQLDTPVLLDKIAQLKLFANQPLINQFIEMGGGNSEPLTTLQQIVKKPQCHSVQIFTKEDETLSDLSLSELSELRWPKKNKSHQIKLIFQDVRLVLQPKRNFWQRLFND